MTVSEERITRLAISLVYDFAIAILYTWTVYQAYVYDAKTQTGGIAVYVMVCGAFALLSRSYFGVFLMNLCSFISMPLIFLMPAVHADAGSYFDFQPFLGMVMTVFSFVVQFAICMMIRTFCERILRMPYQVGISAVAAILFTLIFTIVVHVTNTVHMGVLS